jgi:protein-L-isoaspartate(D-aspartate) O-methyltransferase
VRSKNDLPDGDQVGRLEKLVATARRAGVDDQRVLDAMRQVPRAAFVPLDQIRLAYDDEPVRIPHGQVTTQASLSARMIQALRLAGHENVLEVGTGFGYQTALLAMLASFVTSIERWPDLAENARRNLESQGIGNVLVVDGDGTEGVPAAAPYDAILVSADSHKFPKPRQPTPDRWTWTPSVVGTSKINGITWSGAASTIPVRVSKCFLVM